MQPLVYVEIHDGEPTEGSIALLGRAHALAGCASAVVAGPRASEVATGLSRFGADKTYACSDGMLDPEATQPQVDLLAALVRSQQFDVVMFETSVVACDIASGLSARLEVGVNWDLVDIELQGEDLVGTRLALDDQFSVRVGWRARPFIAVLRPGEGIANEITAQSPVVDVTVEVTAPYSTSRRLEPSEQSQFSHELATARRVVAGGRGIGNRDSLRLLEELADALGGTVAVSMPLVDVGWYPPDRQVGLTGRAVHPDLYIACGISGALAHRVGMSRSHVIVAINTDETAPIFRICHAGVIGDLHKIVPDMTQLIRRRKGG
jgi:electron transfer flavoprotein alpha subunit